MAVLEFNDAKADQERLDASYEEILRIQDEKGVTMIGNEAFLEWVLSDWD